MSGGVDSAVAAARAVDAGHDVVGVHLALSRMPGTLRTGSRGCCTIEDSMDAQRAANVLGIPYYVWDFSDYREPLRAWTFVSGDFEAVAIEPDDFVYADPPYDVEFTHYAKGGFSWEDQERTAAWLSRHRGPVVLVNQATERVERLYRRLGFSVMFLDAPRRISCTGDRTPAREIVGTRNL